MSLSHIEIQILQPPTIVRRIERCQIQSPLFTLSLATHNASADEFEFVGVRNEWLEIGATVPSPVTISEFLASSNGLCANLLVEWLGDRDRFIVGLSTHCWDLRNTLNSLGSVENIDFDYARGPSAVGECGQVDFRDPLCGCKIRVDLLYVLAGPDQPPLVLPSPIVYRINAHGIFVVCLRTTFPTTIG